MKFKTACLWALAALPVVGVLVAGCASVHSSECGVWLTLPANLFLMPTAFAINLFPMATHNEALFWVVFAVVTWAWLVALIFCGSAIIPKRT